MFEHFNQVKEGEKYIEITVQVANLIELEQSFRTFLSLNSSRLPSIESHDLEGVEGFES